MNVVAALAPLIELDCPILATAENQTINFAAGKILLTEALLSVCLFVCVRVSQLLALDNDDGVHRTLAGFSRDCEHDGFLGLRRAGDRTYFRCGQYCQRRKK